MLARRPSVRGQPRANGTRALAGAAHGRGNDRGAPPTPTARPASAGATIEMGDHFFAPKELTVAVGTTVTWRQVGQATHDIKARDGSFVAGNLLPGDTFSYTFTRPGRYDYVCGQHEGDGMVGVITVN